jgi:hypothetical protein
MLATGYHTTWYHNLRDYNLNRIADRDIILYTVEWFSGTKHVKSLSQYFSKEL